MASRYTLRSVLLALACLCVVPASAQAQSTFTGVVKDTPGAVLPGVTVEASSPALIEKSKSVVDRRQRRLPPGRSAAGRLLADLLARRILDRQARRHRAVVGLHDDAEHRHAGRRARRDADRDRRRTGRRRAEHDQVAGAVRETLDAIPTGRTIQGMGQLITGVSLNIPDVGGSRAMQQTYMSAHGMGSSQTTVLVDGLMVNGLDGDGAVQNYFNSSMSQEMVYTTSGASADVSGGGVRLNMIPKDGGNTLQRQLLCRLPEQELPDRQPDRRAEGARPEVGRRHRQAVELRGSLGGPIKKDKVWFFVSARTFHLDTLPADVFNARRLRPGVDPQNINSAQARDHLADQPEEQAVGLQRSPRQEPRRGDDRRLRSGDGLAGVELADLHHRLRQARRRR